MASNKTWNWSFRKSIQYSSNANWCQLTQKKIFKEKNRQQCKYVFVVFCAIGKCMEMLQVESRTDEGSLCIVHNFTSTSIFFFQYKYPFDILYLNQCKQLYCNTWYDWVWNLKWWSQFDCNGMYTFHTVSFDTECSFIGGYNVSSVSHRYIRCSSFRCTMV